jgi:hypothetical protein
MGLDEQLRMVEEMNREELIELGPDEASLRLLQKVYRSPRQPMSRRLRAAIEALPFEQPKLSAIATTSMNGQDFASMLERAIERSGKVREVKMIEGTCEPAPANGATLGQSLAITSSIKRRRIA